MKTALILQAQIRDIEPTISRRIVVPATITLPQLHDVIQIIFGWEDCHLWQFGFGKTDYTCPGSDDDGDFAGPGRDCRSAYDIKLVDALAAKKKFSYWYDFGDDWHVDIKLERTIESDHAVVPQCSEGARAGPPDDCGGPGGYMNLLDVLVGPKNAEQEEMLDWFGGEFDPAKCDLGAMNADLKRAFNQSVKRK